jgi:hypothetical protein
MAEKREAVVEQGADDRIARSEQVAKEAAAYWETTLRGLFALPNATALSVASVVLYTTGALERTYRRMEQLTSRIGEDISRQLENARTQSLPEPERAKRQASA